MFERTPPRPTTSSPRSRLSASYGSAHGHAPAAVQVRDARLHRTDVVAFLTGPPTTTSTRARIDRLRGDLMRMEALLEHRERENNLRDTLLTANRLSEELKEQAHTEAKLIVREAQGRADVLIQKAQVRLDELDHDCNEMKLRRHDAEGAVEGTIQALYRALEFMHDQDATRSDEKILLHRPRQADQTNGQAKPAHAPEAERKASS